MLERSVEGHALELPLEVMDPERWSGPEFRASPDDLAIEKTLRGKFRDVLPRSSYPSILRALERADAVFLDGEPVRTSGDVMRPSLVVEDAPGGFRLREAALASVVLVDGVLHPAGELPLTGRERHEIASGRVFGPNEVGELIGEILPSLRARMQVDVQTSRLPETTRERPRMGLVLERDADDLYVLPHIVYGTPPVARVDGERLVPLGDAVPARDREAERALEERFSRELGLSYGRGELLPTELAIEFVSRLDRFQGHVEGNGRAAFQLHGELEPHLALAGDDFDVGFGSGTRSASPRAVLRAWREGNTVVPLSGGGFAPLPLDWLSRYGTRIGDLLSAKEGRDTLPNAALGDLAALASDLDAPPPPGFERLRQLVEDFESVPEPDLSDALRSALRDYQRQGIAWLAFLKRAGLGALLADDMGLGKTLQALSVLDASKRSLVAAPTSVLQNWVSEAARFRPDLTVHVYHGAKRELDDAAAVTVTSHALLRQDRDVLARTAWDAMILDEAQAIRNPETELAKAAYAVDASFRVSLTGTPIENRLLDLWSQVHFTNPGLLGGLSDFEERYVRPVERGDADALDHLRERIRPFFLRRLKGDVAPELPPRTEVTLHAELTSGERDVYESVRLAARRDVAAKLKEKGNVLAALEALLRLRQAACHSALVPGQHADSSSKTELLLSTVETAAAEGHKSLVFSQWTSMLDLLEPQFRSRGLDFVRLDGSTRDRGTVVERFQTDETIRVFLISLKAGGTGLNLTAADHVFLFDPWWNPAVEQQAFDRAHRIGQTKPVFIHRLVAADTVEERMLTLQEGKRSLSEMATGAAPVSLTKEDLLGLLE